MAKKIFREEEGSTSLDDVYSKKIRRRRRMIFLVSFLIMYVLVFAAAWIIIRSPLFRVGQLVLDGNKDVSSSDAIALAQAEMSANPFMKRMLGFGNMLGWPAAVSAKTLALLPEIKALSIGKNYRTRTIIIHVEERQPIAVWCAMRESRECFWFDDDGVIFKRSMELEGNLIGFVNDYSGRNVGIGSNVLPEHFLSNLFSVLHAVSDSQMSVKELRLNDLSLQELETDTYDGPKVYFSLRFSSDSAAAVITSLMKQGKFNGLEYLDFRVENRAYYK